MTPGPLQILLVILLILLIFGAGRVPDIMENLAKGVKSFKKGMKDEDAQISANKSIKDDSQAEDKSKDASKDD